MSILIEVQSTDVFERKGKNGNYFQQVAWAHLVDRNGNKEPYPRKIRLFAGKGEPDTYPRGKYTIASESFGVSQYDELLINFLVLKPVPAETAKNPPASEAAKKTA
jgi:hypothetical protein